MSLQPHLAYYSAYAGVSAASPTQERDLRGSLARLHRLKHPELSYTAPQLVNVSCGADSSCGDTTVKERRRVGVVSSHLNSEETPVGKLLCETLARVAARGRQLSADEGGFDMVVVHVAEPGRGGAAEADGGACAQLWRSAGGVNGTAGTTESPESAESAESAEEGGADEQSHGTERGAEMEVLTMDMALNGAGIAAAMEGLAQLQLDVLLFGEVGLTARTYLLAFGRLAPVQLAFWGHPVSPNLGDSIDFALTSAYFLQGAKPEGRALPVGNLNTNTNTAGASMDAGAEECDGELHLQWRETGAPGLVPFAEPLICMQSLGTWLAAPAPAEDEDEVTASVQAQAQLAAALAELQEKEYPTGLEKTDSEEGGETPEELSATNAATKEMVGKVEYDEEGEGTEGRDVPEPPRPGMEDVHVYLLPHDLPKLHPAMDAHLASIAQRDPLAVFFVPRGSASGAGAFSVFQTAERAWEARVTAASVPPGPQSQGVVRVAWLPAIASSRLLRGLARRSHAVLDAFGSLGSPVTALEVLAAGEPMVALPGMRSSAPSTHGLYALLAGVLGRPDLARELSCWDERSDCFAAAAVALATDQGGLKSRWREVLRSDEARAALFESEAAVDEWVKLLGGARKPLTEGALTWASPRRPLREAVLDMAVLKRVTAPEPEAEEGKEEATATEKKRFMPHSISIKDNFFL